jgi:hypothetical protein
MQIPGKIKIGGFMVDVEFVSNLVTDRRSLGEYNPRTQTIKLEKDSTQQQREETLLHEVLESIRSIYDIDIEHKDLSNMATALHQVIKDNPEMFKEAEWYDMATNTKPPVGIMPEWLLKEKRLNEVIEAINRYIEAKCTIPIDWVQEYNKLIDELINR